MDDERRQAMGGDYSIDGAMRARSVLRLMRPHRAEGVEKVRLGRSFDGGYVMLDDFENVKVAYSIGIADDVSWDWDMANKGIAIHQYDHTIAGLPLERPGFSWQPVGLCPDRQDREGFLSLAAMITQNLHAEDTDMILKCDVEGAEWDVFSEMDSQLLARFKQIVLEIHYLDHLHEHEFSNRARRALLNLTNSHRVVHVHGNNYSPIVVVGGIAIPSVMEVTLCRKADYKMVESFESFPTPIDMPCDRTSADIFLGRFEF